MVIECSSCHARFKLADDKVKVNGTKVRCTKCREVFTVFPEISPPITTPVPAMTPVVTMGKDAGDDIFADSTSFSIIEDSFSTDTPPVSGEDDWNQKTDPSHFSEDAGTSDLDAINFDNFETPVFSVSPEKNNEIEFTEDTTFSFEDSSVADGSAQQFKIAEETDNQTVATESESDLNADHFLADPAITSPKVLSQSNATTPNVDGEFTFPATENLTAQDTSFDFSSFSFDDLSSSVGPNEDENVTSVALGETTIELSTEAETLLEQVLTNTTSTEGLNVHLAPPDSTDRQENPSSPARQIRPRPRSRKKKKGSTRLVFKATFIILLLLLLAYGIMNRDQLQKEYKNKVSDFIDNQVSVERSGKIGLVKLSGGYLLNNQEGELFVLRGEAINEFKGLRSSVLVRGTIYDEQGAVIQSQSAYGGNPLPDNSLKNLEFKEIRYIMNKELGENLVNLNIAPSKGIPFTIVFNKVPKNIKEFSVEVLESKPGSK